MTPDPRFLGLRVGYVVDNEDPRGLGRVRVCVPGLLEPASGWAFPLGATGGGAAQRGFFDAPDKGAEVAVFFNAGDPDAPFYMTAHWGAPGGQRETPTAVKDLSPEDVPQVKSYETARWQLVFDNRGGKETLLIQDKKTGDAVEFDGVGMGISIKATTTLSLECTGAITIRGAAVEINGRLVAPGAKPIY